MKKNKTIGLLLLGLVIAAPAFAQDYHVVHDRELGEFSPGTQAPSRSRLVSTIENGAPGAILAALEYGERVECHECVPLLQANLLNPNVDSEVRRISAWWLRRRVFGMSVIMRDMRQTLESDADPVRRSLAAAAIGEFLDPNGLTVLSDAATVDTEAQVRASAVTALGRLNHPGGNVALGAALEDNDGSVRAAALGQVLRVNFFREDDALLSTLADPIVDNRRRGALLVGEREIIDAVPALAGMLRGDADPNVRQAAAWALGRIGTNDARSALNEVRATETVSLVQDAIQVALAM